MASKRQLEETKKLLEDINSLYEEQGQRIPYPNADAKKYLSNVKDIEKGIKDLQNQYKKFKSEVALSNDDLSYTRDLFKEINNEIRSSQSITNSYNSSVRKLVSISNDLTNVRKRSLDLSSKELQSLDKQFTKTSNNLQNLQEALFAEEYKFSIQSKGLEKEIEAYKVRDKSVRLTKEERKELKSLEKQLEKSNKKRDEAVARVNNILPGYNDQVLAELSIEQALKSQIKERKAIERSVGVTGNLLKSFGKVTGLTDILQIDEFTSKIQSLATKGIDKEIFNQLDERTPLQINLEKVRQEYGGLYDEFAELNRQGIDARIKVDSGEISKEEFNSIVDNINKGYERVEPLIEAKKKEAEAIYEEIEKLNTKAQKSVKDVAFSPEGIKAFSSIIGNALTEVVTSTESLYLILFNTLKSGFFSVNEQVVQLSKNLALSYDEAQDLRSEFSDVAQAADDTFISTKKLLEANAAFNQILGLQGDIIAKNAENFVQLNKQLGIGIEEATQLQLIAEATGADFREQTLQSYETIQAVSKQFGVQLNVKQVMSEIGKAGSYALAQFQGSVEALTEGAAMAKALGLNLEQVNAVAAKLLDFETSINSELQAELLLGRDINLERARLAALNNDQVTLMEELNREMGDFNDFSSMNRIQQEAMADAIGMSVNELSDALLLEQYRNKNQREITAEAGAETAKRVEMLTTQERFTAAVEKMQDIFINIVEGPLGNFAEMVSGILSNTHAMSAVMGIIGGVQVVKAVAGFTNLLGVLGKIQKTAKLTAIANAAGYAVANPIKAALGLAAAGVAVGGVSALISKATTADDMISSPTGYGKRMLSTPEGTIALNDRDTIVAGTNLTQQNNVDKSVTNQLTTLQQDQKGFEGVLKSMLDKNSITNNLNQNTQQEINNAQTIERIAQQQPMMNVEPKVVVQQPQTPQIQQQTQVVDNSNELKAIQKVLETIATKEGSITMGGTKFGTVTAMNTYQIQ